MPLERTRPMGTPNWGQLPSQPFRLRLPHSIDISTEPPHSPPTPMPWQARRMTRITAARLVRELDRERTPRLGGSARILEACVNIRLQSFLPSLALPRHGLAGRSTPGTAP